MVPRINIQAYCDSPQTAETLRCAEGTVKSQTARALDRLQAVLATPESIEGAHHDR